MARLKRYQNVRVTICAPDHFVRANIHLVLATMGFITVRDTPDLSVVRDTLGDGDTDLLVIDTTHCLEDACTLLRQVRAGELGDNPFPVAIALNEQSVSDGVGKIVDAGFDAMVLRPLDPMLLRQRLSGFLKTRSPFIAVRDYTGPDRRKGPRPGASTAPLIPAPNPVKLMADGIVTRDRLRQLIDSASHTLSEEKVRGMAREAVFLADAVITQGTVQGSAEGTPEEHTAQINNLKRLFLVVKAIRDRVDVTEHGATIEVCTALLDAAHRLVTDKNRQRCDLEKLPGLAREIETALSPSSDIDAPIAA